MEGCLSSPLGVMQGRLLPKYEGRYQAHPLGYWQDEFPLAAELGLDCIEFILDYNDAGSNPLFSPEGRREIQRLSARNGVRVISVCADYFMEAPLHSEEPGVSAASLAVLGTLLEAAEDIGIVDIVIPCVDQSNISNPKNREKLCAALDQIIPKAERSRVNLSLETNLGPLEFTALLKEVGSERVTVNYDTGNSASQGFDPVKELEAYGHKITDVHIKDRTLNGGATMLGAGDWDYECFFSSLKEVDFIGPFILQAFRDDEGLQVFKEQLNWARQIFHK